MKTTTPIYRLPDTDREHIETLLSDASELLTLMDNLMVNDAKPGVLPLIEVIRNKVNQASARLTPRTLALAKEGSHA